jgi:hypothetical protein
VNNSPAQPLLENAAAFKFTYEKNKNLIKLSVALDTNKEKEYEISVFPKNVAIMSSY